MGIMSDFVIADESEAEAVCASSPSESDFEWFETKGVDNFQLAVLLAAAFDRPFDATARLPNSMSDALAIASEEGPAVYQVLPELVERLASLDEAGALAAADRWAAATNEIRRDGARSVLPGLAAFCRRAREKGKGVLLSVAL
jgi:hypothetical protein